MSAVSFPTQCLEVDQHIAICTADLPTCLRLRLVNKYCCALYDTNLLTKLFLKLAPHLASETADGRIEIRPGVFTTLRAAHPGNRWLEMACYAIPRGAFGRLDVPDSHPASTVISVLFRKEFVPMRMQQVEQDIRGCEVRLRELNGDNMDGLLDQAWRVQQEKDEPSRQAECATLQERLRLVSDPANAVVTPLFEQTVSEVSQWTNWDWLPDSLQAVRRTETAEEFCAVVGGVLIILDLVEVMQSMDTDGNADDVRARAREITLRPLAYLQKLGVFPDQRTASWPCLSNPIRETLATTSSSRLRDVVSIRRRLELLDYATLEQERGRLTQTFSENQALLQMLRTCIDNCDVVLCSAYGACGEPVIWRYVQSLQTDLQEALAEVYLPHLTRCYEVLEQQQRARGDGDNQRIRDAINGCPYPVRTRIWKELYDRMAGGAQEWQWAENRCHKYPGTLDSIVRQMLFQYESAKRQLAVRETKLELPVA